MFSDSELVNKILASDKGAFAELINRYKRAVLGVSLRILYDEHLAQDCSQEVFVRAYSKLSTLKNRSAFGPWLLQIARREALNIARKRKKHDSLESVSEMECNKHSSLCNEDSELMAAVMKLSKHEQTVITLRYFESMTVRDIAKVTDRSVGTVTKQLSRAHGRLRKRLGGLAL